MRLGLLLLAIACSEGAPPNEPVDAGRDALPGQVDAGSDASDATAMDAGNDADAPDSGGDALPPSPERQLELEQWYSIEWSLGADRPTGSQESAVGVVGGRLVSSGGYCQGYRDVPGKLDRFPAGFSTATYTTDAASGAAWERIADFPGEARQAAGAIATADSLYVLGGFNYTSGAVGDAWRLSNDGAWRWDRLPDLPAAAAGSAALVIDRYLYLLGGAAYDLTAFPTATTGATLARLDLDGGSAFELLPALPGTPRYLAAASVVAGRIYVIGGISLVPDGRTCNVVDSWVFDPMDGMWSRIRDMPLSIGNYPRGALTYEGRIFLIGGYDHHCAVSPEGVVEPYGQPFASFPEYGVLNDVLVYDPSTDSYGRATPMPVGNTGPSTVVDGDVIHLIGGETGYVVLDGATSPGRPFPNQPDLYLRGRIRAPIEGEPSPVELATYSPRHEATITGRTFDVYGTCRRGLGDVFLVLGSEVHSTACQGTVFRTPLTRSGPAGNVALRVEQRDAAGNRVAEHQIVLGLVD